MIKYLIIVSQTINIRGNKVQINYTYNINNSCSVFVLTIA